MLPICLLSQTYEVSFRSGAVPAADMVLPNSESESLFTTSVYREDYYLVLQFDQIPDSSAIAALEDEGVFLFDYIPNYAYLAKIPVDKPLSELNARAATVYEGQYKLSTDLASGNYPSYAYSNGTLSLIVKPWPSVEVDSLAIDLVTAGYEALQKSGSYLRVNIPEGELMNFANLPGIQYLSFPEPTPEKEGWIGRASHRVNRLMSPGPGLYLEGEGVQAAIADDGSAFHIDKRGRIIDLTNGNDFGPHGDMTSGLFMGAGNLHPDYKGFAPRATLRLYFISGYPHILTAPQNYIQHGTIITSTSFGEGCGGLYTQTTQFIDQQVYTQPQLLHFFSAGNSGNSSCSSIYGAFGYGNITGGRKAGKNVFAVANLFYDDNRVASSSQGPAEDGRIKPDISAFGQGSLSTGPNNTLITGSGTSAAAPTVAGIAALMVEAFRNLNQQQDPTADIIKGIMLNTADDLGRKGPDYDFGWGKVHAARALEALQQQQYTRRLINQGGVQNISIPVPANTKEVKIMLYWTDAQGSPVAAQALVNDLDLKAYAPNGQTHLPWKLSTFPHADSLTRPAQRGIDRVNNMEQVSIENPTAGNYTVQVKGHMVPSGSQSYVVTYTYIKNEVKVVFPYEGASLVPGEEAVIRWDAAGNTGNFIIEYAIGNNSWFPIASNIPGSKRHHVWNVPNLISSNVRLRVRRGGQSDATDGPFNIIGVPQLQVQNAASNGVTLSWAPVSGATTYQVFRLGDRYMEPLQTTTATSITLGAQPGTENWYAISAGVNNRFGKRSMAVFHASGACDETVRLNMHFDQYPGETSWIIKNQNGNIVAAGGPYNNQAPNSIQDFEVCLPYGCFEFIISDSYNNGMCCSNGAGSYRLISANGSILATGGNFNSQETRTFCIDGSSSSPLSLSITQQEDVSCHGLSDGRLAVSASGGTGNYSYVWADGFNGTTRNNLPAGNYKVTVTDGQSQTSLSANVMQPDPITINFIAASPDCHGGNDGSIFTVVTEGTESMYTYNWSNGANTPNINGLTAGTYALTVTNASGCAATKATTLDAPSPLTAQVNASPASCSQASDGSIGVYNISGGSGNYSIVWNNGATAAVLNNVPAGTYSVTITDANLCQAYTSASVGSLQGPQLNFVNVAPTCASAATGRATAVASGGQSPYSYIWSNGSNTASVTGLPIGDYSVTVTDANGCTSSGVVTIEVAETIQVDLNTILPDCGNSSSGAAIASAMGGVPPYTYAWNNGANTASVFGLQPGDYSLTVTDANGCTGTASSTITASSLITLTIERTQPSCVGQNNGSLTATASDGVAPYTYSWSNGQTGSTINGLAPGNYLITVTDASGCSLVQAANLSAPTAIQGSLNVEHATCQGANDGALAVSLSGGTGGYSIQWSNGQMGSSISNLSPGTYTVTATDGNGCSFTNTATIIEESPLSVSFNATNVSCFNGNDGQVSAMISGGSENTATFSWNTGAMSNSLDNLPAGIYSLTITDPAGCQASADVSIIQPQPLATQVNITAAMGDDLGAASVAVYGGTSPYQYLWSNGATTPTVDNLPAGNYSLTITDANGCSTSSSILIEDQMVDVCNSRGASTQYEWIQQLSIGGFTHVSGNDGGHGDFRADSTLWIELSPGTDYDLTLTPGYNGPAYNEYWRIWIDINRDGVFADPAERFLAPDPNNQAVQGTLSLPDTVTNGHYAMRVAMRYGTPPSPCQNFPYGEVEDYIVVVKQALEYCTSSANSSSSEWIESFAVNGQTYTSGNNMGYGDFTDSLITFTAGDTVAFELTPGFSLNPSPEYWQIFIDLNGDGFFSGTDERVYSRDNYPFAFTDSFVLPAGYTQNAVRMRIIMSFDDGADACGSFNWGETEDYTVRILPASSNASEAESLVESRSSKRKGDVLNEQAQFIELFPNPCQDFAFVKVDLPEAATLSYTLYSMEGRLLVQQELQLAAGQQQLPISTELLPSGTYLLRVQSGQQQWQQLLMKQ
jgi:hypothetical protein